jgi:hypothetical protein
MKCQNCKSSATYIKGKMINGKYEETCENCNNVKFHYSIDGSIKAIYTDDKGNVFPVNYKGDIVDKNPYRNDSRGWKYSGKKVK